MCQYLNQTLWQITKIPIFFRECMSKQILHIGIDDTDSPKGMCTTFLAYKIINRLKKENVDFGMEPNKNIFLFLYI